MNSNRSEVKRLQDIIVKQNSLNLILKDQLNMGNGQYQREKAKAGMPIRKRLPFDVNEYIKLHSEGKTQVEIAEVMGISLSTLKRRLREEIDSIFQEDRTEEVEAIIRDLQTEKGE